jgi:hypothetical protein
MKHYSITDQCIMALCKFRKRQKFIPQHSRKSHIVSGGGKAFEKSLFRQFPAFNGIHQPLTVFQRGIFRTIQQFCKKFSVPAGGIAGGGKFCLFQHGVTPGFGGIGGVLTEKGQILIEHRPAWEGKPIKGLLETMQVALVVVGSMVIIGVIIDKSPFGLLAGLGASAAVISFIFKDSLMGLVAGVQLSANNMLKVGDWIEMPSRGIDGVVIGVSLTTIKIRSWNNTHQTIPPYLLISEPFYNWQAMRDSGGRRIKRSLNVDMTSVAFVSDQMIEELRSNSVTSAVMANVIFTSKNTPYSFWGDIIILPSVAVIVWGIIKTASKMLAKKLRK